jgi:tetratricopeptide (TPR) repeat protein
VRFAAGTAAAAEGDYAVALEAFRAALAAGQTGPVVHYNIGVCAWALDDLATAEQAFRDTAAYPAMAPLAHYNLGLVARRRGDLAAAREWFVLARDGSITDPALNQLARAALEEVAPPPPVVATERPPRLAVFLAANAGYDDNVALLADGELLGVSDLSSSFGELQLAALAPLSGDFSIQGGAFLLNYTDLPEFDQLGAQLELLYRPQFGPWRLELGTRFSLNQLDGERFEDARSVSAGVTRRFGPDWRFRWRVDYSDIKGQAPFEGLNGDRLETRLQLRRYLDRQQWQLEYRFETNDRDDPALSPDRHRVDAEWRRELGRGLRLQAGIGWLHSSYDTPGFAWTERRATALLGLSGPVTGAWEWVLRYDFTRNDSSLEEFDYTRNRGFGGVQASF